MARPKSRKNKYILKLTPVSNFMLIKTDDEEQETVVATGTDINDILRFVIRSSDDKELIL